MYKVSEHMLKGIIYQPYLTCQRGGENFGSKSQPAADKTMNA